MLKLLLVAEGGEHWIGGLYYVKNILYSILEAQFSEDIAVVVLVSKENADVFDSFQNQKQVSIISVPSEQIKSDSKYIQFTKGKNRNSLISYLANDLEVDFVFPVTSRPIKGIENKCIYWIPDFQYCHYPEYFSFPARVWKHSLAKSIAKSGRPIVLSSESAKSDYLRYYPYAFEASVGVVHFVSYLDSYEPCLELIRETQKKYGIDGNYFVCCNQFWSHKNHKVILDALAGIEDCNLKVVFSGNPDGGDGGRLFQSLVEYAANAGITERVRFVGFIDRQDQLNLMSGSLGVIQPSLFEGWGTVLEDAKALGKKVILSDIPVHREQMDDSCLLFQPHDSKGLANLMATFSELNTSEMLPSIKVRAESYGSSLLSFLSKRRSVEI